MVKNLRTWVIGVRQRAEQNKKLMGKIVLVFNPKTMNHPISGIVIEVGRFKTRVRVKKFIPILGGFVNLNLWYSHRFIKPSNLGEAGTLMFAQVASTLK